MTTRQKVFTYCVGFAIGCLILMVLPREEHAIRPEHPWHAQTAPEGTFPLTLVDDARRSVALDAQPRWFISLAPNLTELLYAMELGDHLMAVTEWCDFPQAARDLRDAGAQVGAIDAPNRELIAQYRPDLIFASPLTPPEVIDTLQGSRTKVLVLDPTGYADLLDDVRAIGTAVGVPASANRLITRLQAEHAAVMDFLAPFRAQPPLRAVFLLSIEANMQPGWAPGEGSWIADLCTQANAINVTSAIGSEWGQVSMEALIALAPDVLLIRDAESPAANAELDVRIRAMRAHPVWSKVPAVANNRIHRLPYGPFTIPGPRMVQALDAMAKALWQAPQ